VKEDLVEVYEAATLMEARLLADRLGERGIRSFIDNVDSPLDGLTAASRRMSCASFPVTPRRRARS